MPWPGAGRSCCFPLSVPPPPVLALVEKATLPGTGRECSRASLWQRPDCQLSPITQSAPGQAGGAAAPAGRWHLGSLTPCASVWLPPTRLPWAKGLVPQSVSKLWCPLSLSSRGGPSAQTALPSPDPGLPLPRPSLGSLGLLPLLWKEQLLFMKLASSVTTVGPQAKRPAFSEKGWSREVLGGLPRGGAICVGCKENN